MVLVPLPVAMKSYIQQQVLLKKFISIKWSRFLQTANTISKTFCLNLLKTIIHRQYNQQHWRRQIRINEGRLVKFYTTAKADEETKTHWTFVCLNDFLFSTALMYSQFFFFPKSLMNLTSVINCKFCHVFN